MVFQNIFDFTRSASAAGISAETGVSGYIPKQPNETICIPPHDPWQPVVSSVQDPKIVRETSPQAQSVFNLVGALTAAVSQAADTHETVMSDPESSAGPSALLMKVSQEITQRATDNVPSPSPTLVPAPVPSTPQVSEV